MKYPKVYAITLSYNRKDDTIECIKSLQEMTYPNYEILVVENGSTDDSAQAIKGRFPEISLIEIKKNVGYSRGFNTGLEFAYKNGADYFFILNNDTVIDPNALQELVRLAEQDPQVGFVTGKVYFYDDPNRLQTVGKNSHPVFLVGSFIGNKELDLGQYDQITEYNFVDDVFLLVRREVYEQVGGYDPTFFIMYEETDWCVRVRRAGFKIMYTPHAKIWHKGNLEPSTGRSPTQQFYLARNQIPFIRRNATSQHFRRFLVTLLFSYKPPCAPRQAWRLLKQGHFRLLMAHLLGISAGLVWALQNRRPNRSAA